MTRNEIARAILQCVEDIIRRQTISIEGEKEYIESFRCTPEELIRQIKELREMYETA